MNGTLRSREEEKRLLNLPKIFLIYLIATVVLYEFGPIVWKTHNKVLTYLLLAMYFIALAIGFRIGKRKYRCVESIVNSSEHNLERFVKYFYLLSVIFIVLKTIGVQRIVALRGWSSVFDIWTHLFSEGTDVRRRIFTLVVP